MLRLLQKNAIRKNFVHQRGLATALKGLEQTYDVVIIGGGVAGVTLACALGSSPSVSHKRIALVEAMDLGHVQHWKPEQDNYSNRVVSLTPGTMEFFKKIGIQQHLKVNRTHGYRDMRVWDGVTGAHIHLDASILDTDEPTIAYMAENINVQHAALERIEACRAQGVQIDLFQKTKVTGITKETEVPKEGLDLKDWPTVSLDNGKQLKARLLVGADGINSPVRSFAKIESLGWDYNAQGVVATLKVDPARPESSLTAWQRFLPTGPIAMLPLGKGYASIVWSTYPEIAKALKSVSHQDFASLVNAAFRMSHVDLKYLYQQLTHGKECDIKTEYSWREDVAKQPLDEQALLEREYSLPPQVMEVQENSRASFPFRLRNAEHYVTDRVALVGDAAHATHPLAGQGLNQGLLDVQSLSRLIEKGINEGQDVGSIHLLRQYASERYLRNIMMISSCDKLHRLYSTDAAPVAWIRSLGLSAVNQLDSVKAEIIKYAMGVEYNGSANHK